MAWKGKIYFNIVPDPGYPQPRVKTINEWQSNNLDIYVKRVSLAVASSVVSLRVYSGERAVCVGSGFILECDEQFQATILTSGSLFRADPTLNELVPNLKVIVVVENREFCLGQLEVCDFHFNLAVVRFQASQLLRHAKLGHIEDTVRIDSRTHQARVLLPGYKLIALGRFWDCVEDFMVAPGKFSVEDCGFDCKEILRSTCRITKSGIGGPMINHEGEVVGVNFFNENFTPFLPINIVTKWLEHFKKFGDCRRLWLGMKLCNLYTLELLMMERIIHEFPNLKQGVIVGEVTPNSPAGSAGIESQDIIIQCDGAVVESCLQFFDVMWDKVGKPVDLVIARLDGSYHNFSMIVDINPSHFNSWPLLKLDGCTSQRKGKSRKRNIHYIL